MACELFYVGSGGLFRAGIPVELPADMNKVCDLLNEAYRIGCEVGKRAAGVGSNGKVAEPIGFTMFWQAWPTHHRKVNRKKCLAIWRNRALEEVAKSILASVGLWKKSAQWEKNGGEFIPQPQTWLNASTWLAAPPRPAVRIAAAQTHDRAAIELRVAREKQAAHERAVADCIGALDDDECMVLFAEYKREQPVARRVDLSNPRVREWIYEKKRGVVAR